MPTLVIANKNYSSWSLRPWLVLKESGIAFEEIIVPLSQPDSHTNILKYSPSARVPCLIDAELTIWDSLAICEYLAEGRPQLWPAHPAARAHARSISAEMHSGFTAVRQQMPMNCRADLAGRGRTPEVDADIARISAIWEEFRNRYRADGNFLFGAFTIADAMYAPIVWRFRTYGVSLPDVAQHYCDHVVNLPSMQEWLTAARAEPWTIPEYE